MANKEAKPRKVKIVRSQYQPSKAEQEEKVDLSYLEGMFVDDMAKAALETVDIKYISSPSPKRG